MHADRHEWGLRRGARKAKDYFAMNNKKFLARLKKELPTWVERGWVKSGAERAIFEHVASQGGGTRYLTYAFSLLGALLLGTGVITYFAANWGLIPKPGKLTILFGAMWAAYAAAGYFLKDERSPNMGKSLLLFAVILFGANIALVAQIYHIDAHFPNGILLWSLGALLVAYLLRSQPAFIAALVLAIFWTHAETDWPRREVHWSFLLLWAACLPLIYRTQWKPALHLALIGLLLWSLYSFIPIASHWPSGEQLYLVQFYFLAYLALFLLGMLFATYDRLASFAVNVQRYAIFATLVNALVLTFPGLHSGKRYWMHDTAREAASRNWIALMIAALILVAVLALWHRARTKPHGRPAYLVWGQWLIAAILTLLLANLFLTGQHGGLVALAFNLLFFASLLWLLYAGMQREDRFMVNIAFVFFALVLLARYFDTFWTLLNRSYFFMFGGLILLVGGYIMEHQRRRITSKIAAQRGKGEKS